QVINYTVTVSNTGNIDLTGVTVTDGFVTLSGGGSTLAVGHSEILTGSHVVTQDELNAGAALVNTANVTDAQHDSGSSSVTTLVDQDPDWAIVKTAKTSGGDGKTGSIDQPGQVNFYEVQVINGG